MDKKTKDISTFIALVLRHKPDAAGITLDEHGWADANALVNGINREMGTSINMAFLEEIVGTDKKQRYSVKPHTADAACFRLPSFQTVSL